MRALLLAGLVGVMPLTGLHAETRYITDELEITLRSGESTRHAIVRMLPSGTRVEVLEENRESGYARVRTASGVEGWVLRRFLDVEAPARDQLAALRQSVQAAEGGEASLQRELVETGERVRQLEGERDRLLGENAKLQRELEEIRRLSADEIGIGEQNRRLRRRLSSADDRVLELEAESRELRDGTAQDWLVRGAGVLLAGLLLGILLPRIPKRRPKSRW